MLTHIAIIPDGNKKSSVCIVCGDKCKIYKTYCNKHYKQVYRHGRILERTKYDSNEIVYYDDYAEVILYDRNNKEIARTKVDLETVPLASKYKWKIANGYVSSTNSSILLHRLILHLDNQTNNRCLQVDHINHNKLDNRRCNLRIATASQNQMNRLNVVGVYFDKRRQYWRAHIKLNGKCIEVSSLSSYTEALQSRKELEQKYYGDFLCQTT